VDLHLVTYIDCLTPTYLSCSESSRLSVICQLTYFYPRATN